MTDYLVLVAGLAILLVGGDVLIRGAVGVAEKLHVPHLIIGLTIVAMGTSAPELLVSLKAAYEGVGGIAIGNVVGSNIANILIVLALPSLIKPTPSRESGVGRNIAVMIAITVVFMGMLADGRLKRFDGFVLLVLLGLFLYDQFRSARKHRRSASKKAAQEYEEEVGDAPKSVPIMALMVIGGLLALPFGAHLTVQAASNIAASWGVSEEVIGLTVVAVGTSLPEAAAGLLAVLRNHASVALGNVVGSNIFNIAMIMGATGSLVPLTVGERIINVDMWMMLATSLFIALLAHYRLTIGKPMAVGMLAVYVAYAGLMFII